MSSSRLLSSFPLPASLLEKLARAGFVSADDVHELRPAQIAKELGLSAEDALGVLKLIRAEGGGSTAGAVGLSAPAPAVGVSALDLYKAGREKRALITLCEELDAALGGGISTGQLTEIYGVPGIGKTQFGIQLACDVQIPAQFGGLQGQAVYIDTEGSFLPERVAQIAEALVTHLKLNYKQSLACAASSSPDPALAAYMENLSVEFIMSNIFVYRVFDFAEQAACVKMLPEFLAKHPQVRFICMDSIAFHFRAEFEDMGARQRMLQSMAQDLLTLAERHQLAVVLMNQVTTRMDHKNSGYSGGSGSGSSSSGSGSGSGDSQIVAALGDSWAHVCTTRLILFFEGDHKRCAKIIKSPSRKDTTVEFEITIKGVRKRSSAQKRKAAIPNPSAGANDANSMTSSSSSSSSSGM